MLEYRVTQPQLRISRELLRSSKVDFLNTEMRKNQAKCLDIYTSRLKRADLQFKGLPIITVDVDIPFVNG